jgi:hypothetical protein
MILRLLLITITGANIKNSIMQIGCNRLIIKPYKHEKINHYNLNNRSRA